MFYNVQITANVMKWEKAVTDDEKELEKVRNDEARNMEVSSFKPLELVNIDYITGDFLRLFIFNSNLNYLTFANFQVYQKLVSKFSCQKKIHMSELYSTFEPRQNSVTLMS